MKKVIIIGASSGIGKALAELLASNGYSVAITGRREALLKSIQEQNGNQVFYRQMDVMDLTTTGILMGTLVQQLGGLDLLIIAAGIGEENNGLEFEIENEVIKTNVQGFTLLADWGMTFFKKQGHGHLVNISSIAGLRGNGVAPSYNASKAYQLNYLEGLRINAFKAGASITVTDVRPGFVDTAMAKGDGLFWVVPAEKAAKQILRAIHAKKQVVYISKRWKPISYLVRIMPYSILKRL